MDETDDATSATWWVWTLLCACSLASFWSQATVTEERLVPALNVIANHYNIPPDIAGATLMAAGASSPELFSSIVSLFVTHSALGLGTVVGSEIFNQLIICAGATFASKTGKLILDKTILVREVGFYAFAIGLLYYALQDSRQSEDDPEEYYIYISFYQASLLLSGYILYVIVCSYFDAIVSCFTSAKKSARLALASVQQTSYGTTVSKKNLYQGKMDYVMEKVSLCDEPVGNWKSVEYFMPALPAEDGSDLSVMSEDSRINTSKRSTFASTLRITISGTKNKILKSLVKLSERPSEMNALHNVHLNDFKNEISCFLFQRSIFYNKAYFGSHAWQLRWFTISREKMSSVPDCCDANDHTLKYPHFKAIEIDEKHLIIRIVNPVEGKRDYFLMAPSKPIFDKAIQKMELFMNFNCSATSEEIKEADIDDNPDDFDGAEGYESLIEYHMDSTNFETICFFLLLPLRAAIHFTIPDVRMLDENGEPTATIGKAYLSTLSCLLWLIIGSYAMVASLEELGELLGISDAIMGFTVSAAGTSLPNYVASKVAAENGFGNQAVSNAFGSNSFNIMVGLGLPWMLYVSLGNDFEPYHGLKDEHIMDSIFILAGMLGLFLAFMIASDFVMYQWHGIVFLMSYGGYIAYAIMADT